MVKLGEEESSWVEVQCQEQWGFLPLACKYKELLKNSFGHEIEV